MSLQLVKLCSGMIEAGKAYVGASRLFVGGIRDLSQHCQKDQVTSVRLRPRPSRQPGLSPPLFDAEERVCVCRSSWRNVEKVCRRSATTRR